MTKELIAQSEAETRKMGYELGRLAFPGMVVALFGDLGAGKTQFTKGLAEGLGIMEPVTSPTFTLVSEYSGRLSLYHFDVYRLESPEQLFDLGYEEYFFGDGVTAVEWADLILPLLPRERLDVKITAADFTTRKVGVTAHGRDYKQLLREWYRQCMSSV